MCAGAEPLTPSPQRLWRVGDFQAVLQSFKTWEGLFHGGKAPFGRLPSAALGTFAALRQGKQGLPPKDAGQVALPSSIW